MYADKYTHGPRFNPASLGVAIAVNAAVVAALMFANPVFTVIDHDKPFKLIPIEETPPPPPEDIVKPLERQPNRPTETVVAPIPPIPLPPTGETMTTTTEILPPPPIPGTDLGPPVEALPPPPVPLPYVEPAVDPRYAADFQPVYPADERRMSREGRVKLRVQIGVDGRVKQVERLDATSDAFWKAAADRARTKWRFRPATRGGIPVEGWRVMTLTFVLKD